MGGSGDSNPLTKYVIPGLETVGGGVSEIFAPGNPIGISLMGSGIGSLAGGAAGGPTGQSLGGGIGGLLGGLGGGGALGSSMGLPGVSDSSIADMLGSVNPGAGTEIGIAGGEAGGTGAGKGTGGLSSLMGSTGGGASNINSLASLAGPVASLLKPPAPQQKPASINPAKGGGEQAPNLVSGQQPVNRAGTKAGGSQGGQSADLQKLLQLIKMMK